LIPDADRTLASVYVQDNWNPTPRVGVTGGLRLDHYTEFGTQAGPSLAVAYRPRRDLTLKSSYARGVRAPSFRELFYTAPGLYATAALDVMRADTLDLTAVYRRNDLRLSATGYRAWLHHVIAPAVVDSVAPGAGLERRFENLPGIDATGLDLEAAQTFAGNRSVALVYSFQPARESEAGGAVAGVPPPRGRPPATLPAGKYLILSPSVTGRGSRPRAAGDPRPALDGYTYVDVVARVHNFNPRWEITAVVHDLFDQEYFDPSPVGGVPGDYPRAGFAVLVKAQVRF